jgi:hypothetical protein
MRTLTESSPAFVTRELVRQLSRAAALADRALSGSPIEPARGVDYVQRQREIEREARRELRGLRDVLDGLPLE